MDPALPVAAVDEHDVDLVAEAEPADRLDAAGRVEPRALAVVGPQGGHGAVVDEDAGVDLGAGVRHEVQRDDVDAGDGGHEHA